MRKNYNVEVLSITAFFILIFLFSWVYLLPIHLKELGATDRQIGFSYTLFILSFTINQFIGGFLVDRFGRKTMIVMPGFIYPFLFLMMAFSQSWIMVTLSYFLINIVSSFQSPAFTPFVAESGENRERAFALFNASASLGVGMGTLLGSFIIQPLGIKNMILISTIIYLLVAIVRYFFLQETRKGVATITETPRRKISLPTINPNLVAFLLIASLISLSISLTINGPFITLHLRDSLLKSKEQINLLYASGWIVASLVSFIGGNLAKKFGARKILGFSILLHPLFLLLYFLPFNLVIPKIAFFLLAFICFQLMAITQPLLLTSLTHIEERGRVSGLFGAVTGMFSSLGPTIGTELKIAFGALSPFILAQVWGLLAFVAFLVNRLRRLRTYNKPPSPKHT